MKKFRILSGVSLVTTVMFGLAAVNLSTVGVQAQNADTKPETEQNSPQKTSQFTSSNWTVVCRPGSNFKKMVCELSNSITDVKSKQLLVRAAIQGEPHQLVMQLPHGLALKSGVFLQIDEEQEQRIESVTTTQKGVFTNTPISASLLAAMRKGKQMKIIISAVNGKKIIIPIGLNGFSVAFKKFK